MLSLEAMLISYLDCDGRFVLTASEYMYSHGKSAHAQCSKVTATHLSHVGVAFGISHEMMLYCKDDGHLLLEPYNRYILAMYQKKNSIQLLRKKSMISGMTLSS